ncbi:pilus assembly protein CpaE [Spirilliplanes yamanashiensis]|uniref:Pilus assembly protein CpaE n=1 Tax=Spirilliplanes yamanashiensis TaxID=42233 RepID=A0A8J3Y3X0_9ACTN|nr:pilus assembly protein CpaE [Spirilliplanes yamanashiensis]MDP9820188.1 hypothetical protein [Spirilliplanes yamanashiensis]GIJ00992.1 hypothetical protein Sya03_03440 [Spirilliplanes yamanashiensis]
MIALQLARELQEAGLVWKPAAGDRFVIPDRDMDSSVFVLSDMTIEVHTLPEGPVIGFNGTTEWAMDDVEQDEAVWLPREDQLRELLGRTFRGLTRTDDGFRVSTTLLGTDRSFEAPAAEQAYGLALLDLLRAAGD